MVQVEAKYPALLFKQQLDAFVQKIFPMLRDNVKKEITPQLAACIHAPRQATARNRRTRDLGSVLSGDAINLVQICYSWGRCVSCLQGAFFQHDVQLHHCGGGATLQNSLPQTIQARAQVIML